MMEQLYCCDLAPTASLVRACCTRAGEVGVR
jgi:hypothetical protein